MKKTEQRENRKKKKTSTKVKIWKHKYTVTKMCSKKMW